MRGGKDYDSQWNTRMKGTGPYAEMMARRFHMAVKKLGLNQPAKPAGHQQASGARPGLAINSPSSNNGGMPHYIYESRLLKTMAGPDLRRG